MLKQDVRSANSLSQVIFYMFTSAKGSVALFLIEAVESVLSGFFFFFLNLPMKVTWLACDKFGKRSDG